MGAPTPFRRFVSLCVERIYEVAGARISMPPGAGRLALLLLGPAGLDYNPSPDPPPVVLSQDVRHGWRVLVDPRLSDEESSMAIAQGIALWATTIRMVPRLDASLADALPASLVLPAPALAMAVRIHHLEVEQIAATFVCPMHVVVSQMALVDPIRQSGWYRRLLSAG